MKIIKKYAKQMQYLADMLEEEAFEISIGNITIELYFFEINIYIN